MLQELVVDWLRFFPIVLVPGVLIGALLTKVRGYMAVLAVAVAAEVLTLLPAMLDIVRLGWAPLLDLAERGWKAEAAEGLLLLHVLLFVPLALAICTGYFGWRYIRSRAASRTVGQTD